MDDNTLFMITLFGGIILGLAVIVVLDRLGQRKDRKTKQGPAA